MKAANESTWQQPLAAAGKTRPPFHGRDVPEAAGATEAEAIYGVSPDTIVMSWSRGAEKLHRYSAR